MTTTLPSCIEYGIGSEYLRVHLRAFMPLRVAPTDPASLLVTVYQGVVATSAGDKVVATQTVDLTAYVPTDGADYARWVLITINDSAAVVATSGTAVTPITALASGGHPANVPATPTNTVERLALVRMYRTDTNVPQTAIEEIPTSHYTDIVDLRIFGITPWQLALHTNAATAKTTPVDADRFGLVDSAASNIWKYVTWANIKATIFAAFNFAAPTDVGSANASGAAATINRSDHVHKGVHSLAKSGDTALYGDVTLSATGNVTLTQSGQNIAFDMASLGEVEGLARWNADGGTTFELPDYAERIMAVTDDGLTVDPLLYSLTNESQLVFDSGPTAANVVTCDYVVKQG